MHFTHLVVLSSLLSIVSGDVLVVLKTNTDLIKHKAREVSNPTHTNYGKYLTSSDINLLLNISTQCYNDVRNFLDSDSSDFIDKAQAKGTNIVTLPSDKWMPRGSLIPDCVSHVVHSEGNSSLSAKVAFKRRSLGEPEVTPALLASLYAIPFPSDVNRMRLGNRHAVVELAGEHINKDDLTLFFDKFVPNSEPSDSEIVKFVGQPYFPGDGADSLAEVEYIMGTSAGVKTEFWLFDGNSFCGELIKWTAAAEDSDVTVHSLSFGWQAALSDVGCTEQDITTIEAQFAKLALKGASLIVSSGNRGSGSQILGCSSATQQSFSGDTISQPSDVSSASDCCVRCAGDEGCFYWMANITKSHITCSMFPEGAQPQPYTPDPSWRPLGGGKPLTKLWPSWPASSEFVTSVGGTSLIDHGGTYEERCSTEFGSGGGFYPSTTVPDWQQKYVDSYFDQGIVYPPKSSYTEGRGTPDLSLASQNYQMLSEGAQLPMTGTQVATPVFAAIVSLLNEARLQKGMPVMGNIAPWLYQNASHAFTDVTLGNNKIDGSGVPLPFGWEASPGWDPVSGLGTPNFQRLLQVALEDGTP